MTGALSGYLMSAAEHPTNIYKVGLGSVRYLLAVGDLLIGWRLLAQAEIARAALADLRAGGNAGSDKAFYEARSRPRLFSPTTCCRS